MKPEELQDALNHIDDDLIEEANLRRQKKTRVLYWITNIVAGVTAASLIAFLFVLFIGFNSTPSVFFNSEEIHSDILADDKSNVSEDSEDSDASDDKDSSSTIKPDSGIVTKKPSATYNPVSPTPTDYVTDELPDMTNEPATTDSVMDGDPNYGFDEDDLPTDSVKASVVVTIINVSSSDVMRCRVVDGGEEYGLTEGDYVDISLKYAFIEDPEILYIKTRLLVTVGSYDENGNLIATRIERWEG